MPYVKYYLGVYITCALGLFFPFCPPVGTSRKSESEDYLKKLPKGVFHLLSEYLPLGAIDNLAITSKHWNENTQDIRNKKCIEYAGFLIQNLGIEQGKTPSSLA